MKVAVSIPTALFDRAEQTAAQLGLNRSQFYAHAIEEFLQGHGEDPLTARLDDLADEAGSVPGAEVGRRLIDVGAWQW